MGPEEQVTWVFSPEMSPGVVGKSAWRQNVTDTFPPHIRDPGRLGHRHVVLSFGWCHFRARRTRCTCLKAACVHWVRGSRAGQGRRGGVFLALDYGPKDGEAASGSSGPWWESAPVTALPSEWLLSPRFPAERLSPPCHCGHRGRVTRREPSAGALDPASGARSSPSHPITA